MIVKELIAFVAAEIVMNINLLFQVRFWIFDNCIQQILTGVICYLLVRWIIESVSNKKSA